MMDIAAYTRRKLDLINQRQGTSYGEEYYQILFEEVAAENLYSEMTFARERDRGKKGEKVQSIYLTFADGDQVHTRFNGTREDAVKYYGQNNFLTADYGAQVKSIEFGPGDVSILPISEGKRRDPNEFDPYS